MIGLIENKPDIDPRKGEDVPFIEGGITQFPPNPTSPPSFYLSFLSLCFYLSTFLSLRTTMTQKEIRFKDVDFTYQMRPDQKVLKGLNLSILLFFVFFLFFSSFSFSSSSLFLLLLLFLFCFLFFLFLFFFDKALLYLQGRHVPS